MEQSREPGAFYQIDRACGWVRRVFRMRGTIDVIAGDKPPYIENTPPLYRSARAMHRGNARIRGADQWRLARRMLEASLR